ncbi:MAG: hypothetical protein M3R60_00460, partial [Pseudomonadota bacterium]|nr:hypothetical protein [Pseudomonadota bacterium]
AAHGGIVVNAPGLGTLHAEKRARGKCNGDDVFHDEDMDWGGHGLYSMNHAYNKHLFVIIVLQIVAVAFPRQL